MAIFVYMATQHRYAVSSEIILSQALRLGVVLLNSFIIRGTYQHFFYILIIFLYIMFSQL